MPLPHISACEPSALRWSMNQVHASRRSPSTAGASGTSRAADDAQHAVAPEPGAAVAQPADQVRVEPGLRPDGAVGVGQDDEVVLRAVPEKHPGARSRLAHGSIVRAVICAFDRVERGRAARRRARWTAGSRRNHDRCRRTNRRVVLTVRSRASSAVSGAVELARAPARSPAPGTPSGPPAARRRPAPPPRRRSRPPTCGPPGPRSARRARRGRGPGRPRRPDSAAAGSGSWARNGPPVSSMTSSARTIRRPLLGRTAAAAAGSQRGQPGVQARRARRRPARPPAAPGRAGSVPGKSSSSSTART